MKKLIIIAAAVAMASGCSSTPRSRSVDLAGMYASETGQIAIGSVDIIASPEGAESAVIKYDEDNAWLQPSMKLHDLKIYLTGSNSVVNANGIVKSICEALAASKADPVKPDADTSKTE